MWAGDRSVSAAPYAFEGNEKPPDDQDNAPVIVRLYVVRPASLFTLSTFATVCNGKIPSCCPPPPATSRPHYDRHSKLLLLHTITHYCPLLPLCALFQRPGYPKKGFHPSRPSTTAYPVRKRSEIMPVVIIVPAGLAPPRSWSKWRLLAMGSLVILSVYRVEYAYAVLLFHSVFMTIYTGILCLVPYVRQSAMHMVGPATKHTMFATHQNFRHGLPYDSIGI